MFFSAAIVQESIEYNIPHIPTSLLMVWLVWAVLGAVSILIAKRAKPIPTSGIQVVLESALEWIYSVADEIIGPQAPKYYPLFVGLFLSILVSNVIGLIPGLISPTSDPMLTFGLALMVFLYYNYQGIRAKGFGYFKELTGPPLPWYLFPVTVLLTLTEVITMFTKPFSLGLRLFCNIFSKELFLQVLAILAIQFILSPEVIIKLFTAAPVLLRPVIIMLGLVIGFIQALVFMVLSISYIAGAIKAEEH